MSSIRIKNFKLCLAEYVKLHGRDGFSLNTRTKRSDFAREIFEIYDQIRKNDTKTDVDKPKKGMSGYNYFIKTQMKLHSVKFTKATSMWGKLSAEEKASWNEKVNMPDKKEIKKTKDEPKQKKEVPKTKNVKPKKESPPKEIVEEIISDDEYSSDEIYETD